MGYAHTKGGLDFLKPYLATGNTASLNEANKYDTGFIISIVLMQMAVGGLIYFLFFD